MHFLPFPGSRSLLTSRLFCYYFCLFKTLVSFRNEELDGLLGSGGRGGRSKVFVFNLLSLKKTFPRFYSHYCNRRGACSCRIDSIYVYNIHIFLDRQQYIHFQKLLTLFHKFIWHSIINDHSCQVYIIHKFSKTNFLNRIIHLSIKRSPSSIVEAE